MERIGHQHGVIAFMNWLRGQPGVQKRGPKYDQGNMSTWPWPDKLERTLLLIVAEHDAATPAPPPEPQPEPPPQPQVRFAPQTFNPQGGSDARYCVQGLPRNAHGEPFEPSRPDIRYTLDGLCHGGRTNDRIISGLRGAREMDGLNACSGYGPFPGGVEGWPEESYLL